MKLGVVLLGLVAAGVVLLIGTGSALCFRNDYVSDNVTACDYFNGYRLGSILLVDNKATPKCPVIYKMGRYPACPGNHHVPNQSCEEEGS